MPSVGYSDFGEEWAQKWAWRQDTLGTRDTTLEVLLYNQSDNISDSDDVGVVTTEPGDTNGGAVGNYTRDTLNLDSADLSLSVTNGNLEVSGTATFDLTNTTGTYDAYMVVLDFQSDVVNSETGQNAHHIFSAAIPSFDAANFSSGFQVDINLTLS